MKKRNISSRLKYLLWKADLEMTRLVLAVGSILWALLLLLPGQLFTQERTTYLIMSKIGSEVTWGVLFLLQGLVMLYSLLYGYRSKVYFCVDALLGCILWTTATLACFASHYHGWVTYKPPAAMAYDLIGVLTSWWCLVRYSLEKEQVGGNK